MNNPKKQKQSIKDIWFGEEINKVRKSHVNNISTKINVCKKCTFHDVHIWKKI